MPLLSQNRMDHFKFMSQSKRFEYLIESGTSDGNVWIRFHNQFEKIITTELDIAAYNVNKDIVPHNVQCIFGASEDKLEEILKSIPSTKNIIFWLDGHYCGGTTAKGRTDCPLLEECQIINNYFSGEEAIVIVDDKPTFGMTTPYDWSHITFENIQKQFTNFNITNTFEDHEMVSVFITKK